MLRTVLVSIPQAVRIACNKATIPRGSDARFVSTPQAVWIACNTSPRDKSNGCRVVSIPQAVWIACNIFQSASHSHFMSFNTASGMDCMQYQISRLRPPQRKFQYRKRYGLHAMDHSIPRGRCQYAFQYRKRYGLHAIPSLTALGTAEPRSGFSKRIALLDKSPQPRGIFLSPKSAENVRKPCNIKETFVHGKSMKLMAFSPKSLPSL